MTTFETQKSNAFFIFKKRVRRFKKGVADTKMKLQFFLEFLRGSSKSFFFIKFEQRVFLAILENHTKP